MTVQAKLRSASSACPSWFDPIEATAQVPRRPIVSTGAVIDPASGVFDGELTRNDGPQVGIVGWQDNEWGLQPPLNPAPMVGSTV